MLSQTIHKGMSNIHVRSCCTYRQKAWNSSNILFDFHFHPSICSPSLYERYPEQLVNHGMIRKQILANGTSEQSGGLMHGTTHGLTNQLHAACSKIVFLSASHSSEVVPTKIIRRILLSNTYFSSTSSNEIPSCG